MTFCLGINVQDGLVGIADTRVVAGCECLVAKKVATYEGPGFSFFIMTSGLRSLRDKILLYFEEAYTRDISARDRLFKIKIESKCFGECKRRLHNFGINSASMYPDIDGLAKHVEWIFLEQHRPR